MSADDARYARSIATNAGGYAAADAVVCIHHLSPVIEAVKNSRLVLATLRGRPADMRPATCKADNLPQ
jgi:hypothetical protein